MPDTCFISPYGEFQLYRHPADNKQPLRAWDAADQYLLDTWSQLNGSVLICNDHFGALSIALHHLRPVNWSDSWVAHQAARENLQRNGLNADDVEYLPATTVPTGRFEVVLIRVPKNLAFLDYQLTLLRPCLTDQALVVVGGMVKHLPKTLWTRLENLLGPTETSLARQKARLIQVGFDSSIAAPSLKPPTSWRLEAWGLTLQNQTNVFARERLDHGARLLLDHIPPTSGAADVVDLGCGNGVLGLVAAKQNMQANVTFIDESYMAIASAQANAQQLGRRSGKLEFVHADGLSRQAKASADLILCNPPFHQQQALTSSIAWSMFRAAASVLRDGGELWVVGNRHLGYHQVLKNWFTRVKLVASNPKFVVLQASVATRDGSN